MQIFILGTQRSGTQLVRMLVNASGKISTPPTTHMLERMMPLEKYYFNSKERNFYDLVSDTCRLIDLNEPSWKGVNYKAQTIVKNIREKNMLGIMEAFYSQYAEYESKEYWCSKCTGNINYLNEISDFFNFPKFIYVYRDGRDSAVSFKKAPIGEKHIYNIALKWNQDQEKINLFFGESNRENVFYISYEELTEKPKKVTKKLYEFLGLEYTSSVLEFYKGEEAKRASKSGIIWENLSKPIFKNNSNKFLSELSLEEVRIFESIAKDNLLNLGYKLYCREVMYTNKWEKQEVENFININDIEKKKIKSKISPREVKRHKWQYQYMDSLKNRLKSSE